MSQSTRGARGLRMKPIAAGLAVVFAAGVFCLPLDSSATPGSQAWRAVSAAQREEIRPLLQQQRALRLEMVRSRVSGDAGAVTALRGEMKALRQEIRAKAAAPAASGNSMGSLRNRLAAHPEVLEQMRAQLKAQRAQRLATVQARLGVTPKATGVHPKALVPVSNCNDSGAGSLRDAVAGAATGDTIDMTALACSTITLTSGSVAIGQDDLTIAGPGAGTLAIDAGGNSTVFDFTGTGTLAVDAVTLTNGYYSGTSGGAIWAYSGDIALQDSIILNSIVYDGGGAAAYTVYGSIALYNSTVSGNEAYSSGIAMGALTVKYGDVGLVDSTVTNNQADSYVVTLGGGVYANGTATVLRSTVSQNSATGSIYGAWAGGVYANYGTAIVESTISGNHADTNGGGFTAGNLVLVNSTVSGNDSGAYAGGGSVFGGYDGLINSTITDNSAGTAVGGMWAIDPTVINLNSTVAFGNTESSPSVYGADLGGYSGVTVNPAFGNNLVGSSALVLPAGTLTTDPLLGPLANNGGPTLTHALGAGSPAIDTGNNGASLTTDQRGVGFARVVGAAADIGAFEVQMVLTEPPRLVPATSVWGLGLLGTLLGFFGWRQGWFAPSGRRRG